MTLRSLCLCLIVNLLAFPAVAAAQPAVNGRIAFISFRDGHNQIYLMDADGSSQVNICNTAQSLSIHDTYPRWSRDGRKIVFNRFINPPTSVVEIYSMNADCSDVTQLTFDNAHDYGPAWSPDGQRIAFYSDKDSANFQIFVMNADGSGETRLTNNSFSDVTPVWSPDGSQLAFATSRDGNRDNSEIYIMNADGSGQTNLTQNPAYDDGPAWSPDGSKIAFRTVRDGIDDIYVMNANGSSQTRLTGGPDYSPGWSPDGTKIVFGSIRDGSQEIYTVTADGSMPTRLTNNSDGDYMPDWGPAPTNSDTTPPLIVSQIAGTLGNNAWYTSSATVSWMVTDAESGIASSSGCVTTSLTADTAGVTLQCSATNGAGLSASSSRFVKIDTSAPVISGMPAAGCTLWPPNGKMVEVASVTATDSLSGLAALQVTGTSNESATESDVAITPTGSGGYVIALRADRSGTAIGRVYALTTTATDVAGNTNTMTATCIVPHDQR